MHRIRILCVQVTCCPVIEYVQIQNRDPGLDGLFERERETTFSSHNKHNNGFYFFFPILELPDEERNLDVGVEDLLNVNNIFPNNDDEDAVNLLYLS